MEKTVGALEITNSTIDNVLTKILSKNSDVNMKGIHLLLHDMISTNANAAQWFVSFALGVEYPDFVKPGTEGYIKVSDISWHSHARLYETSDLVQNGYIKCVILEFSGLHNYLPLLVLLPTLEGVPDDERGHPIQVKNFHLPKHIDIIEVDNKLPF